MIHVSYALFAFHPYEHTLIVVLIEWLLHSFKRFHTEFQATFFLFSAKDCFIIMAMTL